MDNLPEGVTWIDDGTGDPWVCDEDNNRTEVKFFGTKELALEALLSLKNCYGTTNSWQCEDCTNCSQCWYCKACEDLIKCMGCLSCADCTNCSNLTGKDGEIDWHAQAD